MVYKRTF